MSAGRKRKKNASASRKKRKRTSSTSLAYYSRLKSQRIKIALRKVTRSLVPDHRQLEQQKVT